MIAYLQYTRIERIDDSEVLEYRYYKLENGQWAVISERKWQPDYDSGRYKRMFSKILTFPAPPELQGYDYDIRDIFKDNSMKDMECPEDCKIPVYITYKCPWSGWYMTKRLHS